MGKKVLIHKTISLSSQLRTARKKQGMTQQELAKQTGVTPLTIWRMENKQEGQLTLKILNKVMEVLKLRIITTTQNYTHEPDLQKRLSMTKNPPPCAMCPEETMQECGRTGDTCKKYDKYVADNRSK